MRVADVQLEKVLSNFAMVLAMTGATATTMIRLINSLHFFARSRQEAFLLQHNKRGLAMEQIITGNNSSADQSEILLLN